MTKLTLWDSVKVQLRAQVESHAERQIEPEVRIEYTGFGLAPLKEEGLPYHPNMSSPFHFADMFEGPETDAKWMRLLHKADKHIRACAGPYKWDAVYWRVLPEIETDRDFDRSIKKTKLFFRGMFVDGSGAS